MHIDIDDENHPKNIKIQSVVTYLKEWMASQPHLPHCSDKLLQHIAAASKGNNEIACKKLDSYFTVRTLIPEFYALRDPLNEEIQRSFTSVSFGILPGETIENRCKVLLYGFLDLDPTLFDLCAILRRHFMYLDSLMENNELHPGQGVYVITDTKAFSFSHSLKMSPSILRKTSLCAQDVYPISLKGFIFVNVNEVMKMVINTLVLPIMRYKMRKRVYVFGSQYDKLYKIIPRENLPKELGGYGVTYRELSEQTSQDMTSNRDWFLNEGSVNTDESKRIGKCPITAPGCSVM